MKTWYNGDFVNLTVGQKVTVFRCGSGRTTFGEPATFTKATAKNLVFTTASGAVVRTAADSIHAVCGRAKADGYCVSLKAPEEFTDLIFDEVRFWDAKTCKFVKK